MAKRFVPRMRLAVLVVLVVLPFARAAAGDTARKAEPAAAAAKPNGAGMRIVLAK